MNLNSKLFTMKIITPSFHAILDYLVVAFLLISPSLFAFSPSVSCFTYILAGIHLVLTLATNFKGGLLKIIPFKIHGVIEFLVAIILMVAPWLLSSTNRVDRLFYLVFGFVVFITWMLTNYSDRESDLNDKRLYR
jgi:hypothetical protein